MRGIFYAIILLMVISIKSVAQTTPNSFLNEVYSPTELQRMPDNHIAYLNFISEHGWFLYDSSTGKDISTELSPLFKIDRNSKTVTDEIFSVEDIDNFNILLYSYSTSATRNFYRIDGSEKILVVKSKTEILKEYNEERSKE